MSTPPNFPALIFATISGVSFLGWMSEHNRAERLEKELTEFKPPHKLPPCWTERIEAEDQHKPFRE